MKDFRKKFSLHIHCQRQRTVFPVAGDKHIQRLFHLFQAGKAVFWITVKAGNTAGNVTVNPATACQQAQECPDVWHRWQTCAALASLFHRHDGLQRCLTGWFQGDTRALDDGIIVRPPVTAC
jgi:hypothetical protein